MVGEVIDMENQHISMGYEPDSFVKHSGMAHGNAQESNLPGPAWLPVDRIRLIRRSLRCFMFGLIGVVPFLGLALAVLALQLYHQVLFETGELKGPIKRSYGNILARFLYWLIGTAYILTYYGCYGYLGVISVAGLFWGTPLVFLLHRYWTVTPREWNPARMHLYWGAALAFTGCFTTVILLVLLTLAPIMK